MNGIICFCQSGILSIYQIQELLLDQLVGLEYCVKVTTQLTSTFKYVYSFCVVAHVQCFDVPGERWLSLFVYKKNIIHYKNCLVNKNSKAEIHTEASNMLYE